MLKSRLRKANEVYYIKLTFEGATLTFAGSHKAMIFSIEAI